MRTIRLKDTSNSLSNLSNSVNNNSTGNKSSNRSRNNRKRNRSRLRRLRFLKKRSRENPDNLNNVPNPVCDSSSAIQGSSTNQNGMEPLKVNNLNLFAKIFNDKNNQFIDFNQSIDFKNQKLKKKADILQTKKLLKKSVVNLNNRQNRIASNNCLKNQRIVRLKNHQENKDNNCIVLDHAEEIIVLDDDDDHAISNCDNIQNNSTECDPMDLDVEYLEGLPINQDNVTNSPPKSSINESVINISDSMDVVLSKTDNNDFPSSSNIFFKDINKSAAFKNMPTPSYTLINGFNEFNRNPPQATATTTIKDKNLADDSVIFVSESKAANFISLSGITKNKHIQSYKKIISSPSKKNLLIESYHNIINSPFKSFNFKNASTPNVNKRLQNVKSPNKKGTKKKFSVQDRLLTSREVAQNSKYSTNTYNPNKEKEIVSTKRMVIIDGSNVAFAHALSKEFSVKGLEICLEYFIKMGHEVKAVVPQFRLQKFKSTDPSKLEKLHKQGKIVFTPCKNLPGKSSTCYDDRFILQLAVEFDAAVVSNDNYRDLINETVAFKKIIENRVIGYSWCNDLFILPKDPYGKNGPGLTVILNRV